MDGLNSQLWTNHIFYNYTEQQTNKRGFIFSRYGLWGNHRYPSYFTGDTYADWDVLAYQVPFTAQGGNVLMPYITHDIGGFIYKDISFQLYARWVQFGVFSPFVRLHSAYENPKDGNARMPWTYGQKGIDLVRKYFKLRYSLLPYIYSYTRVAHDEALPIVRPCYLEYPDLDKVYSYPYEYFFGKEFLVAPITDSTDTKEIYLPPGEWIDYFTQEIFSGDRVIKRTYPIDRIPVFVKSGSIIITQPDMAYSDQKPLDHINIDIYGNSSSSFELYEDDGLTLDYNKGKYAKTPFIYKVDKSGKSIVEIGPTKGIFDGQIEKRSYTLRIPCDKEVNSVVMNKIELSKEKWSRDKGLKTLSIEVGMTSIKESIKIEVR
jgi:alpha-glucosidase (family GH31 glycosyl hydrolase)